MEIEVIVANFEDPKHGSDIVYLLNCYASDPMGGGMPLSEYTKQNLATELAKRPHAFTVICYVDQQPAGLINCFEAFSSFNCQPLINIHDVIVASDFRGLGISQRMLEKVEQIARDKGCCKLTLEILEGNDVAQASYKKFGFSGYELDPEMGEAMFWQKLL